MESTTNIQSSTTSPLRCRNCESTNVNVQAINEQDFRKGHGCLFTVLFGIYYWCWFIIKWTCKYTVYLFYWIFAGWMQLIIAKKNNRPFEKPAFINKMMQKSGKMYNNVNTYVVCQDCGYREKIK